MVEIKWHKRLIVTNTKGHLLNMKVHVTNTNHSIAGYSLFEEALRKYPFLKGDCVDLGY